MKKLLILSIPLLILTSCMNRVDDTAKTPAKTEKGVQSNENKVSAPGMTVAINYTLKDGSENGKIIETTLEDVAKANGLYKTGAQFKPFEVTLGQSAVIKGFEQGITGVKKGDKKTLTISPKDGYGESTQEETAERFQLAPSFQMVIEQERFIDKITRTVPKTELGEQGKDLVVGKKIVGEQGLSAEVTNIEGDNVTLVIDNKINPFYGRKLEKGATAEVESGSVLFTIDSISESGVVLNVVNKKSVFTNDTFKVGGKTKTPNGQEITIKKIDGDKVTVESLNAHPLAGKTLVFEIEVVDVK